MVIAKSELTSPQVHPTRNPCCAWLNWILQQRSPVSTVHRLNFCVSVCLGVWGWLLPRKEQYSFVLASRQDNNTNAYYSFTYSYSISWLQPRHLECEKFLLRVVLPSSASIARASRFGSGRFCWTTCSNPIKDHAQLYDNGLQCRTWKALRTSRHSRLIKA